MMLTSLFNSFVVGTGVATSLSATNNTAFNGLANKILGLILIVLIVVFSGKLIGMFQQRQYAQLIVLFLVGSFAFWFVASPGSFITIMTNILNGLFSST